MKQDSKRLVELWRQVLVCHIRSYTDEGHELTRFGVCWGMAGMCSRHQDNDPNCPTCQLKPEDVLPDYEKKLAEAEAAGRVICPECDYEFYLTTHDCPLCGETLSEEFLLGVGVG